MKEALMAANVNGNGNGNNNGNGADPVSSIVAIVNGNGVQQAGHGRSPSIVFPSIQKKPVFLGSNTTVESALRDQAYKVKSK
jgi:hypothetical protein